jgi:uncharacterized membrane protein (UPF0127 family)
MGAARVRFHVKAWQLGLPLGLLAALGLGHGVDGSAAEGQAARPPQQLPITAQWCLSGQPVCIGLEVARTPQQQSFGLQRRPRLAPLRGMWFPYSTPTPVRFWMHLTPEPLDMLFVRDGRVVTVVAQARPFMHLPCPSYGPGTPVDGVVELAGGEAARLGLKAGTPVTITPLPLSRSPGAAAP